MRPSFFLVALSSDRKWFERLSVGGMVGSRVTNRLFWKPVNRLTVAIFQLTETGYFSRYYRLIWLEQLFCNIV